MSGCCSKCAARLHGSNRIGVCLKCQEAAICEDCGVKVSVKSKGRCRPCTNAAINRDADKRALMSAAMRRRYADPAEREARRERSRTAAAIRMQDPAYVEQLRHWGRTVGSKNIDATRSAEARAKAGKSISATKLAHIPAAYRALYRSLRAQAVPAPEAERMVHDQRRKDEFDAPQAVARAIAAQQAKHARQQAEAY